MGKKIFILSLLIALSTTVFAITPKNDWRNMGTAKKLEGKTYVLLIFVSYPGTEWNQVNINSVVGQVYAATSWLTKTAAKYGTKAEFEIYSLGNYENDGMRITMAAPALSTTLVDDAMVAAGYPRNYDFEKYVRENTDCNNCLVLVCSNEVGRCFAVTHTKELSDWNRTYIGSDYKLEGCIIYLTSIYDGSLVWSSTIAHEMLHCFGAWDLYDVYGTNSYEKNTLLEQYFSNSIMRTIAYNIDTLVLDDMSAYLVGLRSEREDWYEYFEAY